MNEQNINIEMEKLLQIREEFYRFLDANLKQDKVSKAYDFSTNPTLNAKEVYEHFFKLDYQARKIRCFLEQSLKDK